MSAKEIPFKQWLAEEAMRAHITPNSVWCRLRRLGWYPKLKLRKVSPKTIYVQVPPTHPVTEGGR